MVSSIAGLQLPVMLLLEVDGNVNEVPLQTGPTCVKVGTVCGVMLTVMVAVVAHWPAVGVNV